MTGERNRPELAALEDQLYSHVVGAIDFDALFGLEQLLWGLLDQLGFGDEDLESSLSKAMITRALVRAAHDPATSFTDVPHGISKAEAKAAAFDEACPFCRFEAEEAERPAVEDDTCCGELARQWREQHAEALARRGLR